MLGPMGRGVLSREEAYERHRAAALRAVELDPTLAEAWASLGLLKQLYDWDWDEAGRAFERAIELSPGYPPGHSWYGAYLIARGRFDEAEAQIRAALELDPLSVSPNLALAGLHYYARRYEAAVAQYRHLVELSPALYVPHMDMAQALDQLGRHEEAVAEAEKALELSPGNPEAITILAHALATAGQRGPRAGAARAARGRPARRAHRRALVPLPGPAGPRRPGGGARLAGAGGRRALAPPQLHRGRAPPRRPARRGPLPGPRRAGRPRALSERREGPPPGIGRGPCR